MGRVQGASGGLYKVVLLTDPSSAVGVVCDRSAVKGVAVGKGSDMDVRWVSNESDVRVGDQFSTSGEDGVFPAGPARRHSGLGGGRRRLPEENHPGALLADGRPHLGPPPEEVRWLGASSPPLLLLLLAAGVQTLIPLVSGSLTIADPYLRYS